MTKPNAEYIPCTIKELSPDKWVEAAEFAVRENPANAVSMRGIAALAAIGPTDPMDLAVYTGSYWGVGGVDLSVQFLDTPDAETRRMILDPEIGMNAWGRSGTGGGNSKVRFRYTTGEGDVRIFRGGGGYASYLGTGIRFVAKGEPTMWLQYFTASTPASEYRRVVKHETGHTLGFPHEHLRKQIVDRIDPQKAYTYFWNTQKWSKAAVDGNVLTPLSPGAIRASQEVDSRSIMCYALPGTIMKDGIPVPGGGDIDPIDAAFSASQYPGSWGPVSPPPPPEPPPPNVPGAWGEGCAGGGKARWRGRSTAGTVEVVPIVGYGGPLSVACSPDRQRVVVATGPGTLPRAVVYDWTGRVLAGPFAVFADSWTGGVNVAVSGGLIHFTPMNGGGPVLVEFDWDGRYRGSRNEPGFDGGIRTGLSCFMVGDPNLGSAPSAELPDPTACPTD